MWQKTLMIFVKKTETGCGEESDQKGTGQTHFRKIEVQSDPHKKSKAEVAQDMKQPVRLRTDRSGNGFSAEVQNQKHLCGGR